jgi:hypothetical protein
MARRLKRLTIDRVDVVDRGANFDPGTNDGSFIVIAKREAPADDPAIAELKSKIEKEVRENLSKATKGATTMADNETIDLLDPSAADQFGRLPSAEQQMAVDHLRKSFRDRGRVAKRAPSSLLSAAMDEVITQVMKRDHLPRAEATVSAIKAQPALYRALNAERRDEVARVTDYD